MGVIDNHYFPKFDHSKTNSHLVEILYLIYTNLCYFGKIKVKTCHLLIYIYICLETTNLLMAEFL